MTNLSNFSGKPAIKSGTYALGNEFHVNRLGFGAMRLTGAGVWGEPDNHAEAINVLNRVIELGINFIDTADAYGPEISENLIAEALYPYPDDLVIATKGGLTRPGPNEWTVNGNPSHLRLACEQSLKRLKIEQIQLYQLHRIDSKVPLEDQIGLLAELQKEGKIRHIGLSEVDLNQLKMVQNIIPVASVQNKYNLIERNSEDVLDYCTEQNIAFIPWFPLATGNLTNPTTGLLNSIAEKFGVRPSQIALAWLLKKSPAMLPIPGTSKLMHLEENTAAALLELDELTMDALNQIV